MATGRAAAVWVPIDTVKPWRDNPRKNKPVAEVSNSLAEWGFGEVIVARAADGEIIAGHTRHEAALALGETEVPVRFLEISARDAHRLARALNKLGELGSWDAAKLLEQLQADHASSPASIITQGFNEGEIARLLRAVRQQDKTTEPVIESPTKAITKPGDLWILGDHRLLCGDSTAAADLARLLQKGKPRLMVTDPPYGVDYDGAWRDGIDRLGELKRTTPIVGDTQASWPAVWASTPAQVAYVWHGALETDVVARDLMAGGFEKRAQIIWHKSNPVIGRGHYHWRHEVCWYAVRKGSTAEWIGDRKQHSVWTMASPGSFTDRSGGEATPHSNQKPIEAMQRPMGNHKGDVHDPFAGSGTSIVAAEEAGRRCYAMEVDPRCCDIAVQRWQDKTGKKAKRSRR